MKKEYNEYKIGEIVSIRGKKYKIALKKIRERFSPSAQQTFKTPLLYLEGIKTENRIARVKASGTLEFEWHREFQYKKHKNEKRIMETWK